MENGLIGVAGNDGQLRAATNRIETTSKFWLTFLFDHPDSNAPGLTQYEGISGPGDSGGPAFIMHGDTVFIAGISSWQNNRATNGVEGLYGVTDTIPE